MDATDAAILRELAWNPEDPRHRGRGYLRPWDVAKKLKLHRNTVVRRLDALRATGVYQGTHLYPSPEVSGIRMALYEFAFASAPAKAAGLHRLRLDPRVQEIHDFLGDLAWVPIAVAETDSLEKAVEELHRESGARSLRFLSTWDWPRLQGPVSPLDRRILEALHEDATRALSEVAEEVGVTAKTVRLRLKALQRAHAFTVLPAVSLARVRGCVAFVLAVAFTPETRAAGHTALLDAFPEALLVSGPREETSWLFLTSPDTAGVEACRERAAAIPGATEARALLVKALLDC
ncbi:MAG TPA: AsnC family transcriptional regulator [Candidatus Thermoplasmatota archaeon]|nr:AsnC family transcriptional regulator [Candidatus Thermoplasmatota archaeon]